MARKGHSPTVAELRGKLDGVTRVGAHRVTGVMLWRRREQTGVHVVPGTVEIRGATDLRYDYDLMVDVREQAPSVRVVGVNVIARDGDAVAARTVAEELGRAKLRAITALSSPIDRRGRGPGNPLGYGVSEADVRAAMKGPSTGPIRNAPTPEDVAALYREAQQKGKPTSAYVAHAVGVSKSTAKKYVHRTRKAGHLPPAESTRPRL